MKYKDAIKKSMEMLAEEDNTLFLGYNISFGSYAYGTLKDIPSWKKIETPVAENLMMGLAMGLALEGYRPIVFFERHDFMLNSLDAIVNHLDKIPEMSKGQFKMPVIIRAAIGSKFPLNPGPQHVQDFSKTFRGIIKFPIYDPQNSEEILSVYHTIKNSTNPSMIIEKKELYEIE